MLEKTQGQELAGLGTGDGLAIGTGSNATDTTDTAFGTGANVGADSGTAIGSGANIATVATNAVAVGAGSSVTAASGTAIGQGASATANGAVAIGQGSVANQANTVSVGSVGSERRVTNVAAGTAATDAANVGQVQAAMRTLGIGQHLHRHHRDADADPRQYLHRQPHAGVRRPVQAVGQWRGRRNWHSTITASTNRVRWVRPCSTWPPAPPACNTQNRVGVGVGFQNGATALSIGYQRAISDRANFTLGGAASSDDTSIGAGIGLGW